MSKIALASNVDGTGTFTLASPNSNSDRTLNLPDNSGTVLTTASTFAGTGPAFSAYPNVTQSLSGNTFTKILFQVEEFDTASCYDTSNSSFTPNVAGYYQINARVRPNATNGEAEIAIYKNGSVFRNGSNISVSSGTQNGTVVSSLVYMNGTTDYLEIYIFQTNSSTASASSSSVYFQGFLARAA